VCTRYLTIRRILLGGVPGARCGEWPSESRRVENPRGGVPTCDASGTEPGETPSGAVNPVATQGPVVHPGLVVCRTVGLDIAIAPCRRPGDHLLGVDRKEQDPRRCPATGVVVEDTEQQPRARDQVTDALRHS
jgi:hypothetical protein